MKLFHKNWFSIVIILFSTLSFISCNNNRWPNISQLNNKYEQNRSTFDSLVSWGFDNSRGANPKYLSFDSIPLSQRNIYRKLDLKMILVQKNDCGFGKNGNGCVIFEFNKTDNEKIFHYLMFNQDVSTESRRHISKNGRITQINNHWYLVQKRFNWLQE